MKIWRVWVNTSRSQYDERSEQLVYATDAKRAIDKAVAQARKDGFYKSYEAQRVEFVGDAL